MSYNVEYLPVARKDMVEIAVYISQVLQEPAAAANLAERLVEAGEALADFPYAYPPYYPIRPLKYEYRKRIVQNYMILYRVDEQSKTITICRVLYAKRDYNSLLE